MALLYRKHYQVCDYCNKNKLVVCKIDMNTTTLYICGSCHEEQKRFKKRHKR